MKQTHDLLQCGNYYILIILTSVFHLGECEEIVKKYGDFTLSQ